MSAIFCTELIYSRLHVEGFTGLVEKDVIHSSTIDTTIHKKSLSLIRSPSHILQH